MSASITSGNKYRGGVAKAATCIQALKFEKVMSADSVCSSADVHCRWNLRSIFTIASYELGQERGANMTKADLIDEVSRLAELTRKDSEVIVETIFDSVVRSLRAGDKIEIRGFGSFRTRQRRPRVGRNPKTGERVEVPAKKIPFFKPSKELKDLVNETTTAAPPAAPPAAPAPPTA
jgi:integration host factor subunit beta